MATMKPQAEWPEPVGVAAMRVTAPMVTALTLNNRVVYLYRDDVVPAGLTEASVEHLRSLGFISES